MTTTPTNKTWKDWAGVPQGQATEGLRFAQSMIEAGFEAINHSWDKTSIDVPQVTPPLKELMFRKGDTHVWGTVRGWQVAELIDGYYVNHRGSVGAEKPFKDRFNESDGFIPDLLTVIELDKKGEL